jgi:hypothetical protein
VIHFGEEEHHAKGIRQEFSLNVLYCGGLMAGYVSYLLSGLVLLMIYGDDGQAGHPGKFLMYLLLVGSLGLLGIGGFSMGLKLSSRTFKSNK